MEQIYALEVLNKADCWDNDAHCWDFNKSWTWIGLPFILRHHLTSCFNLAECYSPNAFAGLRLGECSEWGETARQTVKKSSSVYFVNISDSTEPTLQSTAQDYAGNDLYDFLNRTLILYHGVRSVEERFRLFSILPAPERIPSAVILIKTRERAFRVAGRASQCSSTRLVQSLIRG